MSTRWTLTLDAVSPTELAHFWGAALGYAPAPVPEGYLDWDAWFDAFDVPPDEREAGAFLTDPAGVLPQLSIMRVPEPKSAKNRLHLDLQVSGGRKVAADTRRAAILAEVQRLTALGAGVVAEVHERGLLDHVVLADPEGNEFCVV